VVAGEVHDGSRVLTRKALSEVPGLPVLRREQATLVQVHDEYVVRVGNLGYAASLNGVRPRVEVAAESVRQPAWFLDRVPEILEGLGHLTAEVDH
jgi:hypothetical protein